MRQVLTKSLPFVMLFFITLLPLSAFSHEGQGQPDVYKGSLGNYQITMKLKAESASLANPDVFPVRGEYWIGKNSKNKIRLKGTLRFMNGFGRYTLEAYNSNGKKCGSLILDEKTNYTNWVTTLNGTMKNTSGTTSKVTLRQQ